MDQLATLFFGAEKSLNVNSGNQEREGLARV
jgi:hypothetical protein